MGTLSCYICAMSPKPSPQDWWGLGWIPDPKWPNLVVSNFGALGWPSLFCHWPKNQKKTDPQREKRIQWPWEDKMRDFDPSLGPVWGWPYFCLGASWLVPAIYTRALTNKALFSSPSTHSSAISPTTKVPSLTQVSTPLRPPSSSLLMAQLLEPPAYQTFLLRSHRCLKLKFLLFFHCSLSEKIAPSHQ